MKPRKPLLGVLLVSTAISLAAGSVRAAEESDVLSPALREAMKGLSAEDFATREKSAKQIQMVLGQQLAALASADDPETQSRLTAILEFNSGLIRWSLETLKLPDEQRKAQLKWGLQPEVLQVVGLVYSTQADKRVEGVKKLGKFEGDEASALLARLLDDPDRAVYVTAMDVVYDRKPTDAIVSSLWMRAVEAGMAVYNGQPANVGGNIVFRGRNLGAVVYDNAIYRRAQDNQVAAEVLVNMKSPLVTEKLVALFEKAAKELGSGRNNNNVWVYQAQNEPMKNAYRIAEVYKSKELVPALYKLAIQQSPNKSQGQLGQERYFFSNRTTPLATLWRVTDQSTDDLKLKKMTQLSGLWCTPTERDENNAVDKVKTWWQANAVKYGVALEAADTPSTQPTTQPAEGPAVEQGPVVLPRPILRRGPVQVNPEVIQQQKLDVQVQVDPR